MTGRRRYTGWQRQAAGLEADVVRAEEPFQHPRRDTAFDTVRRVVVRDGRSRHQWRPGRVAARPRVTVRIRILNRGDRSPIVVVVLGLERADVPVGQTHVEQAEQACLLPEVKPTAGGDDSGDSVPLQRRALDPEEGDLGLLVGARAGGGLVVAPETLYLVEICRVLPPGDGIWGAWTLGPQVAIAPLPSVRNRAERRGIVGFNTRYARIDAGLWQGRVHRLAKDRNQHIAGRRRPRWP